MFAVPGNHEQPQRIGQQGTQYAQGECSEGKWKNERQDRFVEREDGKMFPGNVRSFRHPQQKKARPHGGAQNRSNRPGIVDECADQESGKIHPEGPSQENGAGTMQPIGRRERNKNSDSKRSGRPLRRFSEVERFPDFRAEVVDRSHDADMANRQVYRRLKCSKPFLTSCWFRSSGSASCCPNVSGFISPIQEIGTFVRLETCVTRW